MNMCASLKRLLPSYSDGEAHPSEVSIGAALPVRSALARNAGSYSSSAPGKSERCPENRVRPRQTSHREMTYWLSVGSWNASRSCCAIHSPVGCSVLLKWRDNAKPSAPKLGPISTVHHECAELLRFVCHGVEESSKFVDCSGSAGQFVS